MTLQIDTGPDGTIATTPDLAARLRDALAQDEDVVLDASALATADVSLLQVVAAARSQAALLGRRLLLAHPANPVLADLVAQSGLLWAGDPEDSQFWHHEGLAA